MLGDVGCKVVLPSDSRGPQREAVSMEKAKDPIGKDAKNKEHNVKDTVEVDDSGS